MTPEQLEWRDIECDLRAKTRTLHAALSGKVVDDPEDYWIDIVELLRGWVDFWNHKPAKAVDKPVTSVQPDEIVSMMSDVCVMPDDLVPNDTRGARMSMSTHVVGIRPPDEKWQKMKAIWDSCQAAGVDAPEEVEEFFDGSDNYPPDPKGIQIDLTDLQCVKEWNGGEHDCAGGYELEIAKLPKNITHIRFYNSW